MTKNNQDRNGTRTVTTGPNGASDPQFAALFRPRSPEMHDKLAVRHIIAALRAPGALCAEVGNMLDGQSKTGSFLPQGRPTNAWREVRGVSLDPSTFVDAEDEQGNAA